MRCSGMKYPDQFRHSALRTISGGICWGLAFRLEEVTQFLLPGYQWTLNIFTFNSDRFRFFLVRANIIASYPRSIRPLFGTLSTLLSAKINHDFCHWSQIFHRAAEHLPPEHRNCHKTVYPCLTAENFIFCRTLVFLVFWPWQT